VRRELLKDRQRVWRLRVSQHDRRIATQTVQPRASERRAADQAAQFIVRHRRDRPRIDHAARRPWQVRRLVSCRGLAVPRANILADVASEQPLPHFAPQVVRDRAAQLDRQVTDAPPAVELVWPDECVGRAGVEAASTRAAVVGGVRLVVIQFEVGEQRAQKDPTAQPLVDEHGVLADPTDAGQSREVALEQRCRVDDGSRTTAGRCIVQEIAEPPQSVPHHRVVVVAPGVARDAPVERTGRLWVSRAIVHGDHDNAAYAVKHVTRMFSRGDMAIHVTHLACEPAMEPIAEVRHALWRHRRRHAHEFEPQLAGLHLQSFGRRHGREWRFNHQGR